MAKISGQQLLFYASGRRHAEAKAKREREDLADRFQQLNGETVAEIRALRSELMRVHMIEDALLERERAEQRWLH